MAVENSTEPLPAGTVVKIRNSAFDRAKITEYLGPLGPKGARVYGILVQKKPRLYLEVLEEQIEVLGEESAPPDQARPLVPPARKP